MSLRALDGCEVTTKFPYGVVRKLSGLQQCEVDPIGWTGIGVT